MSSISNVPYCARTINGVIILADGNGTVIQDGTITTGSLNTDSFATNDFAVNTNIDLTGDTSQLRFTYDPLQTAFIDRNSVNFDKGTVGEIYSDSIQNTGQITTYGLFPKTPVGNVNCSIFSTDVMGGRDATSSNNIGIGRLTVVGNTTVSSVNTGGYNTCVGHFAGQKITAGNYNTYMGWGAGRANLDNDPYGYASNNTVVGYNAFQLWGGDNNALFGDNVCNATGSASYKVNQCSVFGSGAGAFLNDIAGATIMGYDAANALSRNGLTCYGAGALSSTTAGEESTAFGLNAGQAFGTTGTGIGNSGLFLGLGAGTGSSFGFPSYGAGVMCIGNYNTAMGNNLSLYGHYLTYTGDDVAVFGSTNFYNNNKQQLLVLEKNILYSNQYINTNGITLAFGTGENVLITSNTVVSLTLPTPNATYSQWNSGATFTIVKAVAGATWNITVNAPSGQTIGTGSATASTYVISGAYATFKCVGNTGTSWYVSCADAGGATPTLSAVMTAGNTASTTLDMNNNPITNAAGITSLGTSQQMRNVVSFPTLFSVAQSTAQNVQAIGNSVLTVLNPTSLFPPSNVFASGFNIAMNCVTTVSAMANSQFYGENILTANTTEGVRNTTIMGSSIATGRQIGMDYAILIGTSLITAVASVGSVGTSILIGFMHAIGTATNVLTRSVIIGDTFTSTSTLPQQQITSVGYNNTCSGQLDCVTIGGSNTTTTGSNHTGIFGSSNTISGRNYSMSIGYNNTSVADEIRIGGTNGTSPLTTYINGYLTIPQGVFISGSFIAMTGATTLTKLNYGIVTTITTSGAAGQVLTIPAAAGLGGVSLEIHNNSIFYVTLSHTNAILGQYGSAATTQVLPSMQKIRLVSNGTQWTAVQVWGVPFSRSRSSGTTVQTLALANTWYAVLFGTDNTNIVGTNATSTNSWGGALLTYTAGTGVFTNSTGTHMVINVSYNLFFPVATANRQAYIFIPSYTQPTIGLSVVSTGYGNNISGSATFVLKNNDTFSIQVQTSAAGQTIGSATVASANSIIITRVG